MTTHSARLGYPSSSPTALVVTITGTPLLTQDGLHVCKGCARASVTTQVARIHSAGKREVSGPHQVGPATLPFPHPIPPSPAVDFDEEGKGSWLHIVRLTCPNLQTTFCVHFETTRKRLLSLHSGVILVSENLSLSFLDINRWATEGSQRVRGASQLCISSAGISHSRTHSPPCTARVCLFQHIPRGFLMLKLLTSLKVTVNKKAKVASLLKPCRRLP